MFIVRLTDLQQVHVYEKRTSSDFERTPTYVYVRSILANVQPVTSQIDRTEYGERTADMLRLIAHEGIDRGDRVSLVSTSESKPIYEVIEVVNYSDHYTITLERAKR